MLRRRRGSPRCIVIAGPNGAGKITFAREFLSKEAEVVHFVNPDLIASFANGAVRNAEAFAVLLDALRHDLERATSWVKLCAIKEEKSRSRRL